MSQKMQKNTEKMLDLEQSIYGLDSSFIYEICNRNMYVRLKRIKEKTESILVSFVVSRSKCAGYNKYHLRHDRQLLSVQSEPT